MSVVPQVSHRHRTLMYESDTQSSERSRADPAPDVPELEPATAALFGQYSHLSGPELNTHLLAVVSRSSQE